jgi:hypothetical protein
MMPVWKRSLVLMSLLLLCFVTLRAQQSEPFKFNLNARETSSETKWFTATETRPAQNQTTTDTYVFPDSATRFRRYVKHTVGPFALLRSATSAGLNQWDDNPVEWGQGAKGYGKRFASNLGGNAIKQTVTYGLSEAFRLDTGFEKSKRKGFWPRLSDALVQNVTSRTRSGKRVVSAPIIAGTYAGAIIPTETWYPERYSYKDGLREGTYSLATGFVINAVREFIFNW